MTSYQIVFVALACIVVPFLTFMLIREFKKAKKVRTAPAKIFADHSQVKAKPIKKKYAPVSMSPFHKWLYYEQGYKIFFLCMQNVGLLYTYTKLYETQSKAQP